MNKVKLYSIITAVIAQIFLIFIVYFNPYKIVPLINPVTQSYLSALFNALSAISMAISYFFIKKKKVKLHIIFVHLGLLFSAIFLINYILYHMSVGHVVFNNEVYRILYLTILITHLACSFICLPLIFMSYALGIFKQISEHKRTAKITFFLWEYVSITGVIIVLMLQNLNQ